VSKNDHSTYRPDALDSIASTYYAQDNVTRTYGCGYYGVEGRSELRFYIDFFVVNDRDESCLTTNVMASALFTRLEWSNLLWSPVSHEGWLGPFD
jgi:hypothetical protein